MCAAVNGWELKVDESLCETDISTTKNGLPLICALCLQVYFLSKVGLRRSSHVGDLTHWC